MANATCFHQDTWGHRFCPTHSLCSRGAFRPKPPWLSSYPGPHLTKKHQHRCLRTLCMALRVFQRIPYPRENRLLWVLTAVGSKGRGWELALCIELVPGYLVPSLTPHLSLALILEQVSQRVGWMPPLVPRLNNIELLSEKRFSFQICFNPRDYLEGKIWVWC